MSRIASAAVKPPSEVVAVREQLAELVRLAHRPIQGGIIPDAFKRMFGVSLRAHMQEEGVECKLRVLMASIESVVVDPATASKDPVYLYRPAVASSMETVTKGVPFKADVPITVAKSTPAAIAKSGAPVSAAQVSAGAPGASCSACGAAFGVRVAAQSRRRKHVLDDCPVRFACRYCGDDHGENAHGEDSTGTSADAVPAVCASTV